MIISDDARKRFAKHRADVAALLDSSSKRWGYEPQRAMVAVVMDLFEIVTAQDHAIERLRVELAKLKAPRAPGEGA